MNRVTSSCFALTFFLCQYLLFTSIAGNSHINILLTPAIYVASEGNSSAVQFTCTVSLSLPLTFKVDNSSLHTIDKSGRGIDSDKVNSTISVLNILPLQVNHNSSVQCYAVLMDAELIIFSKIGVLLVQGRLSAPPELTIMNSTHHKYRLLSWTPPFTLDLTDHEPDIIGYKVCFNISSLDTAAAEMPQHCFFTQNISYTYPNVRLFFQFSVTPLNVLGDGYSSFATHLPCTAAPDFMAVDELMLQVSLSAGRKFLINASFRLPPQTTCYDAYQLVLVNSSSSSSSSPFPVVSPILLPSITEQDTPMLQVLHTFADLAENTIYSVSLLASDQKSMTEYGSLISTYDIQAVSLTEEGPGSLKLTCNFLGNSTAQGCRLTLCKLDDEVSLPCMNVSLSRDSPIVVLEDLVGGVYMITLVADLEEDGNLSVLSDLSPLALQQIALSRGTGSEDGLKPTTRSTSGIIIVAALGMLILVVVTITLIWVYFYKKNKKNSYRLEDWNKKTSHIDWRRTSASLSASESP